MPTLILFYSQTFLLAAIQMACWIRGESWKSSNVQWIKNRYFARFLIVCKCASSDVRWVETVEAWNVYKIHNFARNPEVFFLKSSRSSTTELQESKQKLIIQISNVNDDLWLMATYDTCEAHKNPSKIIVCSNFIHKICSTNLHDERVSCLIFIWAMMSVKLEPVAQLLAFVQSRRREFISPIFGHPCQMTK